jgi:antitoxin (DNA-binding transcriptional repressor) of toxin-antitoxin stability system
VRGPWTCALQLDSSRSVAAGSAEGLCAAIRRGADLRIATEFRHNEHIDVTSDNAELVREVADFRTTYLIDGRWVAGIMTLRQPVSLPDGFGPRPSMSFFMYNQDGRQAIARPFLDGQPAAPKPGRSAPAEIAGMPRYHQEDEWDAGTNAPNSNFVYDFDVFRYFVRDAWREVYAADVQGNRLSGSLDELIEAFSRGAEVKVAVRGACADLVPGPASALDHELFVHAGPGYYYTERKLFIVGTHPTVRVRPGIPMRYETGNWDFGWLLVRTDGHVARLLYDPYSLRPRRAVHRCAVRWFIERPRAGA